MTTQRATADDPDRIDKLHELLAFTLESEGDFTEKRAAFLAHHFASLKEFLRVPLEYFQNIPSLSGKKIFALKPAQIEAINQIRNSRILNEKRTLADNFLIVVTRSFVRTQIKMLDEMSLDKLSPNPFLIQCLNLRTPREVVELNVFMFATRSIVTSMGFFVEKLLFASSEHAQVCEKPWDILKVDGQGRRHWIQVKSGPNDMDADQIRHWSRLIAKKIRAGDQAYIGMSYGKRSTKSVTMGLLETYLPDWKKRTLVGRELWDFISGDATYHERVFPILTEAASQVLGTDSIASRINVCVDRLTDEFSLRYNSSSQAVAKYIAEIF